MASPLQRVWLLSSISILALTIVYVLSNFIVPSLSNIIYKLAHISIIVCYTTVIISKKQIKASRESFAEVLALPEAPFVFLSLFSLLTSAAFLTLLPPAMLQSCQLILTLAPQQPQNDRLQKLAKTLQQQPQEIIKAVARLEFYTYFALIAFGFMGHVSFFLPLIYYQYLTMRCRIATESQSQGSEIFQSITNVAAKIPVLGVFIGKLINFFNPVRLQQ